MSHPNGCNQCKEVLYDTHVQRVDGDGDTYSVYHGLTHRTLLLLVHTPEYTGSGLVRSHSLLVRYHSETAPSTTPLTARQVHAGHEKRRKHAADDWTSVARSYERCRCSQAGTACHSLLILSAAGTMGSAKRSRSSVVEVYFCCCRYHEYRRGLERWWC